MKVVRTLAHTYIHIHKKCIEIVDGEVLSTQHHLYVQIAFILNPSFERGSASSSSTIGGIIHQLVYTHLPFGRPYSTLCCWWYRPKLYDDNFLRGLFVVFFFWFSRRKIIITQPVSLLARTTGSWLNFRSGIKLRSTPLPPTVVVTE